MVEKEFLKVSLKRRARRSESVVVVATTNPH